MVSTPRTPKPSWSMHDAPSASHLTPTYTGYANAHALPSKSPETRSSTKRSLLTHTEKQQEHLLPQLTDLCRALRTGLINSPHRELLWKGAWTTNLIASFEDTARANTRDNPWRTPMASSLLTKTLQNFGTITTFVLNAWKLRRRAAFQIHQKICSWLTPSFFDHVPACHT